MIERGADRCPGWTEVGIVVAIFFGLAAGYFSDVLFGPNILVTTNPYLQEPWRTYAQAADLERKPGILDSFGAYYPRRVELSRSLSAGRFPLWNPYVFGGIPFFADPQSRVLDPVSLALAPADPGRAMGWDVAMHVFLAMLGMYLFIRTVGGTALGAALGGISYGMSAFMMRQLAHPSFVASAAWIPFAFCAFETALRSERRGTIFLALVLAVMYLSGFPQILLFGVGAVLLYALWAAAELGLRRKRVSKERVPGDTGIPAPWWLGIKALVIAGVLASLLVSVHLLPFREYLKNGVGLGLTLEQMKVFLSHPAGLVRILIPEFFAGAARAGWGPGPLLEAAGIRLTPSTVAYCGVGTLLAALGSIAFLARSRQVRALWVLLAASLALGTSEIMLSVAYSVIPYISYSQIARISVVSCFAISALGGIGLSLASRTEEARRRRAFAVIVAVVVIVVVALYAFVGIARGEYAAKFLKMYAGATANVASWLAFERSVVGRTAAFALASLVLFAALLYGGSRKRRFCLLVSGAIVLVLSIDLVGAHREVYVSQPAAAFRAVPGIEALRGMLGYRDAADRSAEPAGRWRTEAFEEKRQVLIVNSNEIYGISSISGRSTIEPASAADLEMARGSSGGAPKAMANLLRGLRVREFSAGAGERGRPTSRVDDLASVRFLLADSLDAEFYSAPLQAGALRDSTLLRRLGMFEAGGRRQFAFVAQMGESLSFEMQFPDARYLDFEIASGGIGSAGGPVEFQVICEGGGVRAEHSQVLDAAQSSAGWTACRLDISIIGDSRGRLIMFASVPAGRVQTDMKAAWGSMEFVAADCSVRASEGGYELAAVEAGRALSLDLNSRSREIPLEILVGDSLAALRWIAFPQGMEERHVCLGFEHEAGSVVRVRSDSAFVLTAARSSSVAFPHLADYSLVYDADMNIVENHAAVEKGICLRKAWGEIGSDARGPVLKTGDPGRVRGFQCGTCRLLSYAPESVELEVSSNEDCFLLFQDLYYPGWTATVDGVRTGILRTDAGMRAIEISRGRHMVEMRFRPSGLMPGLALSLAGVVGVVLVGFGWRAGFRIRRRRPA